MEPYLTIPYKYESTLLFRLNFSFLRLYLKNFFVQISTLNHKKYMSNTVGTTNIYHQHIYNMYIYFIFFQNLKTLHNKV